MAFAYSAETIAPGAITYGALDNFLVSSVVVLVVWMTIETLFLSLFGTTPGRLIFGIRLRRIDGGKLTLSQAFNRSVLVFVTGLGLGFPIVTLVTQYAAYAQLRDHGATSWDVSQACLVTHARWGPFRALLATVVSLAAFFLLGILNMMAKAP